MERIVVFLPAPAGLDVGDATAVRAWRKRPPAAERPLAGDRLRSMLDWLVGDYEASSSSIDGGIALHIPGQHCSLELFADRIVYRGVPGHPLAFRLIKELCGWTGWLAHDDAERAVIDGDPRAKRWSERVLDRLLERGLIDVRPSNRPMVLRKLDEVRDDAPEDAVAALIDFAESDNAVDELFGEADELVAVLQTLS